MGINKLFKNNIDQDETKEDFREELKEELIQGVTSSTTYTLTFLKWFAISIGIGIICGLAGTAFFKSISIVTDLREHYNLIYYFLPIGGLLIIGLYHLLGVRHDKGTNLVLDSIHSHEQIPETMAPLIFVGTVITHLFGGSAGREGAAIQMGGCIGVFLGKRFKMTEKDINVITMCGMSAVFSAMFGTPVTATVFSMEVISVGLFHYSAFLPCIVAASISYGIANYFGVHGETFIISKITEIDAVLCLRVILISIICGVIAILFCQTVHMTQKIYRRFFHNQYLRIVVGGCIVCLITVLLGTHDYCGAGFNLITQAISNNSNINPFSFLIKIILTALTLGAGFKGGEIVPALCVGATFGNVFAPIIGIDPSIGAALCMICLFCGVTNCPIASLLLAIEMLGSPYLILFCLAISVSYVFSGYFGLYKSQKIVYSKLHAEFINKHSH